MTRSRRSKSFRLARASAILFLAVIAAYLAVGAYLATKLTEPVRQAPRTLLASLTNSTEEIRIRSRDGLALASTFMPMAGSDRAVLLVHSFNSCRSCEFDGRFVEFANQLRAAGFNILMIDLRGHGESEGSHVTFGQEEKWDVLGAVDWLHQRDFTKIGVLGVSLGAVSTVEAAVEPNGGQDLRALVLDSCFGDFHGTLVKNLTEMSGYPDVVLPGALLMVRLLLHDDLDATRPSEQLPQIKVPLMLIYSQRDYLIPADEIPKMLAAGPNAQEWVVNDGGHARIYNAHPEEYVARVTTFFSRSLQ